MKNYWRPKKLHYNFDTDKDGVPDHKDCQPFNYREQHSRTWEKQLLASELVKRDQPEEFLTEMKRGWTEEQVVSKMRKKPGSNLLKITRRHERVSKFQDAIAFCAEDIQRTQEVKEYITRHNLKDLGSEIHF